MSSPLPESLQAALAAVAAWLEAARIPGVIIGGVAASLLGRPRLTRDIDTLVDVPDDQWAHVVSSARGFGIEPRIADPIDVARRTRVLLLRHSDSQIDVDVLMGWLPFERDVVSAGQSRGVGGVQVRLPRVEDLMIMKAIAHRPRDLEDLEALLSANPKADVGRVRQWVNEFAVAATLPDLVEEFDRLVARVRAEPKTS